MKLIFVAMVLSVIMAYKSFVANALDGSTWSVKVRPKTLFAFSSKDTLVFDHGTFVSSRQLSEGYLPSGYAVREHSADLARFEASLAAGDGSVMDWSGDIEGDKVEGTVVWTRGKRTKRYSFEGRRKQDAGHPFERRLSGLWRRLRF